MCDVTCHDNACRYRDRLHRRRQAGCRRPGWAIDLHQPSQHLRDRGRGAARRRLHVRRRLPRRARCAARVGQGPRARARPRDRQRRSSHGDQQGGALAPGHARGRQAVRRIARRGAGDHRHLRLLHRRGPAPVRPDRAVGDAEQAALHVPHAGRRRRDHHRRQLPGRRACVVPGAGDPVRQRGRLEAGRVLACARRRDGQAVPGRRCPRRRAQPRAGRGRRDVRRPRARAGGAARRQGRLHRLERGRLQDRRAVRPPPAVSVPGARRQEPDGRDGRRRRRPRRRGRAVRRLRHGRPALHVARHRDRPRVGARRVRPQARRAAALGPDRRSRRRTCSTARCCTSASPSASRTGSG